MKTNRIYSMAVMLIVEMFMLVSCVSVVRNLA